MATICGALMANVPVTCTWSHSKFLKNVSKPHRSICTFYSCYTSTADAETKTTTLKAYFLFLVFLTSSVVSRDPDPGLQRSL